MKEVTNNTSGSLDIGGVLISAGATESVSVEALESSKIHEIWVKTKAISVNENLKKATASAKGTKEKTSTKDASKK